jgi:hypothetical protein
MPHDDKQFAVVELVITEDTVGYQHVLRLCGIRNPHVPHAEEDYA